MYGYDAAALRLYAAETASKDVSDTTGDREIQNWINAAIRRVWTEHDWNWAVSSGRITYDVVATGSGLTVTQGSSALTLVAETFLQKYVDEEWHLHVSGETTMSFELLEITSPTTANMKSGHVWTQASDTGVSYTWSRHKYPLPESFSKVLSVRAMQTREVVSFLDPYRFDRTRQIAPTQRGNDPIHFTIRKHALEVWPAPSTAYRTLLVTYYRGPTTYDPAELGTTEIDWPDDWSDLIEKAVALEASITLGKNAPIPYGLAKTEYEARLAIYKAEDANVSDVSGPMSLNMGWERWDNAWNVSPRSSTIPEV